VSDAELQADAALLQAVVEGRVERDDPRVRELLRRRPEWRGLHLADDAPLDAPAFEAQTSEEDRRLVSECLAEARAGARPRSVSGPRRKPRALLLAVLAVAAALVLFLLTRDRHASEEPVRRDGEMLGTSDGLECAPPSETAPGVLTFAWTWKGELEPNGHFRLTVWALEADGARGRLHYEGDARRSPIKLRLEELPDWPERILWRIEVLESNGVPGPFCEGRSPR